jgi:hypothetical protein
MFMMKRSGTRKEEEEEEEDGLFLSAADFCSLNTF